MAETTEKSILIDVNLSTDESIRKTLELQAILDKLYKEKQGNDKENIKALEKGSVEYEKNAAAIKATELQIRSWQQISIKAQQTELATKNTIERTRLELALVSAQWAKAKQMYAINSDEVKKLTEQKLALTEALKKEESATGDNRRNVGNYMESAKALQDQLKGLVYQLIDMQKNGQTNTVIFQKLKEKTVEVQQKIGDLKTEMVTYSREVKNIEGVISIFSGLQTAVEGVQQGMQLMGFQNKDLNQSIQKLAQVMAVLNSINAIAQLLDKESIAIGFIKSIQLKAAIVSKNLETAAESRGIVVKYAAAAAQRVLNLVMAANPIGLLIAAVAALATAFYVLTGKTLMLIEAQKALVNQEKANIDYAKQLMEFKQTATEKLIQNEELTIEKAKKRGANEIEILKMELNVIEMRKKANEENIKMSEDQIKNIDKYRADLLQLRDTEKTVTLMLEEMRKKGYDMENDREVKKGQALLELTKSEIENKKAVIDNVNNLESQRTEIEKSRIQKSKQLSDKEFEEKIKNMELDLQIEIAKQKELENTRILEEKYYNEQKKQIESNYQKESNIAKEKIKDQKELNLQLLNIENKKNKELLSLEDQRIQALIKQSEIELQNWKLLNQSKLDDKKAWIDKTVEAEKQRLIDEYLREKSAIETNGALLKESQLEIDNKTIALKENLEKTLIAIDEKYIDKKKSLKEYENKLKLDASNKGSLDELKARIQALNIQKEEEIKQSGLLIQNEKDKADAIILINKKFNKEKLDLYLDFSQAQLQKTNDINTVIGDLNNANNELELTKLQSKYQEEKDAQDELYSNNLITKKEYEDNIKAIDKKATVESNKLAREQASNNKKVAIAETIINTLASSINVFKSLSSIPYVGYALGAAAAVATVATGYLTVQKIQNTPLPGGSTGGGEGLSGGMVSNETPKALGYQNPQNVNSGIVSRQTVINNTQSTNVNQPVLVVDDVTNKQMKQSNTDKLGTI